MRNVTLTMQMLLAFITLLVLAVVVSCYVNPVGFAELGHEASVALADPMAISK